MAQHIVRQINSLMGKGDFAAALKRLKPILKKEPRNAGLQNVTGVCTARAVSQNGAVPYFTRAVNLDPNNNEFRCNLTLALVLTGKHELAQPHIDQLMKEIPDDHRPHHYSAMVAAGALDFEAVLKHTDRMLELDTDNIDALKLRGDALTEMQQPQEALKCFQTIVAIKPEDLNALKALAQSLSMLGQREAAVSLYFAMLEINPNEPFAIHQVALLCSEEQFSDAEDLVERLEQTPSKSVSAQILSLLAKANLLRRQKKLEQAMPYYAKMHRIDKKVRPWNPNTGSQHFEKMVQSFPLHELPTPLPATDIAQPVFVVGLPRSGTTLAEMILSAAPDVFPCGELHAWHPILTEILEDPEARFSDSFYDIQKAYRKNMPPLPDGTKAFTDKMPANYQNLGPLLTAFSSARVVHLKRDPRDVALSMWTRRFKHPGMNYTNRLEWIADQANLYRKYMNHWEKAFPDQILSMPYEELVRDMPKSTRAMAAHCGIDWSENMLHPEKNKSQVRTASIWQVREGVHSGSIGRWHVFGEDLTKLTDNLDPELWPELENALAST